MIGPTFTAICEQADYRASVPDCYVPAPLTSAGQPDYRKLPEPRICITTAAGTFAVLNDAQVGDALAQLQPATRSPLAPDGYWLGVKDGDPRARSLFKRHYSYRTYKDGRNPKLFVGPGEKMVLLTVNCDALFVWRKFDDLRHEPGVNCAVFRNESHIRASTLILEAMELAWQRWPGERLYTYVNAKKIRSSNPGYCFKMAGWRLCGETKGGLTILEIEA